MKLDEPFSFLDQTGNRIEIEPVELCAEKRIYLLLGFESDYIEKKQYLRLMIILIGNNTKLFAQDIATLNDATVYSVGATFIVTKK